MTKTMLEKIKEMNIPVGNPIEVIVKASDNQNFKAMGYFVEVCKNGSENKDWEKYGTLVYNISTGKPWDSDSPTRQEIGTYYIEDIKILEYKKQNDKRYNKKIKS
jgi:hypothetical protein